MVDPSSWISLPYMARRNEGSRNRKAYNLVTAEASGLFCRVFFQIMSSSLVPSWFSTTLDLPCQETISRKPLGKFWVSDHCASAGIVLLRRPYGRNC